MTKIPLVLIEEHHEAFLVWQWALHRGLVDATKNALIHVDRHADMGVPKLLRPFASLGSTLEEAREFTYRELNIETFIWTAVYQGLLEEWCWVREKPVPTSRWGRMFIHALDASAREFRTDNLGEFEAPDLPPDARIVRGKTLTTSGRADVTCAVLLDIDEDYFSCNAAPDLDGRRIEVTAEAHREFIEDDLHFLRISPGSRVTARQEGHRYYLCFNDYPYATHKRTEASKELIGARVAALGEFLRTQRISPRVITICRSRISGYTPRSQWEFIEETLIGELHRLYPLDVRELATIVPNTSFEAASSR